MPVQDHVLPFCMDYRFPRDTLFLVFEEDFRFWPEEKEPLAAAVKYGKRADEYGYPADAARGASPPQPCGQLALAGAASSSASPPQQTDRREAMPPESRRQITKFHVAPEKGYAEFWHGRHNGFDEDLANLVRHLTMAARCDVGEIVWCSWCANQQRVSHVGYGSQLIAMSAWGATSMFNAIRYGHMEPGHWDVVLKKWLHSTPEKQQEVGFSYILPPIGHSGSTKVVATPNGLPRKSCKASLVGEKMGMPRNNQVA